MASRGRKGGPTRMDLRRQNDAAETREEEVKEVDEEEEDEDEDEDEDEGEEEAADDGEADAAGDEDDGGDDDDEDAPKKKKKVVKKKEVAKKAAPKRTRVPKEVRMKAVWVVLDNSSKRVGSFPFSQRKEAESALAKKLEDKPGFYIQLVKEPLE